MGTISMAGAPETPPTAAASGELLPAGPLAAEEAVTAGIAGVPVLVGGAAGTALAGALCAEATAGEGLVLTSPAGMDSVLVSAGADEPY
ncbi:MAG: hypothetical protein ACO37H_07355, partial [Burkholderiaceae bacterium]